MGDANNNIETLPIDILRMLMQLLLAVGFESFFNFFIAWSQTQGPPLILSLLEALPVRDTYKFSNRGSDVDKSYFNRFMSIAENLGVADVILYQRCRGILCAAGNIEAHFEAIEGLVATGHFGSMVTNFIVRILYKKESSINTAQALAEIFHHPQYKYGIGPVLNDLDNIYAGCGCPEGNTQSCFGMVFPIHLTDQKMLSLKDYIGVVDCFFCATNLMLNVFSRGGSNM